MLYRSSLALACLAASASALSLRPDAEEDARFTQECRVVMRNNDDVDYTVKLNVGGQVVAVIPDTGSFAMVLFSDMCESCGERQRLLHPKELRNLKTGNHRAVQNYGSGDTYSADAYAPAEVQCEKGDSPGPEFIRASKQMFWMTVKANLPIAEESSFQGIMGMGPPKSDWKMATLEAQEAVREVAQMKSQGMDIDKYKPIVENLKDVATFTRTVKPWLENEGLTTFSVCLLNQPGQDGLLIYNDRMVFERPSLFTPIAMDTNGPYWQTTFSGVTLGSPLDRDRIRTSGTTQAILDTGTSLIGAPAWFVQGVVDFVSARLDALGCDDVSKWPDFGFTLGGVELALPASSYLGKVVAENALIKEDPRLYGRMPHLLKNGTTCTAMIFSTTSDEVSEQGEEGDGEDEYVREGILQKLAEDTSPEWIFGLPFFRTYYTAFHLSKEATAARRVFLAEANDDCEIQGRPDRRTDKAVEEMRVPSRQQLVGPMAIDPRKLRFPPRRPVRREARAFHAAKRLAA